MYASAIKNLMSGTYGTIEKANLQALRLHYTNLIFAHYYVAIIVFLWNSLSYTLWRRWFISLS